MADFLKKNPDTKLVITGYSDRETGSRSRNLRLARNRSKAVFNLLVDKYQIPYDRIFTKIMGEDMEQPYAEPSKNRMAICVVE